MTLTKAVATVHSSQRTSALLSEPARICFPFTGDVVGGSHISALALLQNLDRARYCPLVVTQYQDGKVARLFREGGLPVTTPFDWPELSLNRPAGVKAIKAACFSLVQQLRFLRQNRIDIVHTNDGRTHAAWALAAKLGGAKLLWHHRGHPDARGLRFAAPLLADRVLAVSEFALPRPGWLSAARKAQVVHSPFDTERSIDRAEARQSLLRELEVHPETLLIAYSGSFIERKRPLLFVEAIARMRELAPDRPVCGLMFGNAEDPEMDHLLRGTISTHALERVVKLMGWRAPGPFWLAASDLLLIPAVDEPFGRTLIEAMLVGTPVVATRSGGNTEALLNGELGPLVEPESASALAEAVLSLSPEDRRILSEKGQASARLRFGIEMHSRQVSEVYESLLASR